MTFLDHSAIDNESNYWVQRHNPLKSRKSLDKQKVQVVAKGKGVRLVIWCT